jgi:hypothetical protein
MQGKILGIGLSKTGTKSLIGALAQCGLRTAHYIEHIHTMRGMGTWFHGDFATDSLADCDAAADLPIAPFFAQLDRRYPGSKFILTVREIESWLASTRKHWQRSPLKKRRINLGKKSSADQYRRLLRLTTYGIDDFCEDRFRWVYETHLRNVLTHFENRPQDLLLLDICGGEAWDRLGPFLDSIVKSPAPGMQFPWENKAPQRELAARAA